MPLIRKNPNEINTASGQAEPLVLSLTDASADARWKAARFAADHPDSVPRLAQALTSESDARVREAIFTSFVRIATAESVLAVLPYIRSDDANLRTGALDALRAMPSLIEPHLPQLITDPDNDVRVLACELARVATAADVPELLCRLVETEPEANVCAAAVDVLAEIGNSDAVSSLERCATRFPGDPFLGFAIKAAMDRLTKQGDRA